MPATKHSLTRASLLLSALLLGCNEQARILNSQPQAAIRYDASAYQANLQDSSGRSVQMQRAWLSLVEVRLERDCNDLQYLAVGRRPWRFQWIASAEAHSGDTAATAFTPQVLDLPRDRSLGRILVTEPGDYCGLSLLFLRAPALAVSLTPEMLDHSVMLEGLVDGQPFALNTRRALLPVYRRFAQPLRLSTEHLPQLVLKMDSREWFSAVDVSALADSDAQEQVLNALVDSVSVSVNP